MTETEGCNHTESPPEHRDPELLTLQPKAPERVSFISGEGHQPDYEQLGRTAQMSDSGASLLIEILAQTGHIEPLHQIAKYRSDAQWQEALEAKQTMTSLSKAEADRLRTLKQFTGSNSKLQLWEDVEKRVNLARDYYRTTILKDAVSGGTAYHTDLMDAIRDNTVEYENTSLLTTIDKLKNTLPQPRLDARGRSQPSIAEQIAKQNVVEADRLVRILILEETGQLSFD